MGLNFIENSEKLCDIILVNIEILGHHVKVNNALHFHNHNRSLD